MQNIKLVEMRYRDEGHFIDDLEVYEEFTDFRFNYFPFATPSWWPYKNILLSHHASRLGVLFLWINMLFRRNDKMFILSASFSQLFLVAILTLNFNFYFRIHSLPVKNSRLNKYLIIFLAKYSMGAAVCTDFVKQYLIEEGVVTDKNCRVLPCRVFDDDFNNFSDTSYRDKGQRKTILYLGEYNNFKDLTVLESVLENNVFQNLNFKICGRGVTSVFDKSTPDNVTVVDRFIEKEEYISLISECDFVLLPYKKSYGVRGSAMLNDALAARKLIIATNVPQFVDAVKNYHIGFVYSNDLELFDLLKRIDDGVDIRPNFSHYSSQFSRKRFINVFSEMFAG